MKKILTYIIITLLLGGTVVLADSTISSLTELTSVDPLDVLPITDVSTGITKKIKVSNLVTGVGVGTSTNPFMATYFVATSTTATSTFNGSVGIGSGISSYDGMNVLDVYVSNVKARSVASTTAGTLLIYPVTQDGFCSLNYYIDVNSISTNTFRGSVTFTDIEGSSKNFVGSTLSTVTSTVSNSVYPCRAGTNITFGTELVAGGGSMNYDVYVQIGRITTLDF